MADGSIDTAYVDIKPRFNRFAADTERGIKRELSRVEESGSVAVASRARGGVKDAAGDIGKASAATKGLSNNAVAATSALSLMGGTAARTGTIAAAGVAGIGIAAALAVTKVTQASIAFESAFAGVRKTVQATEPELQQIRKDILDLSTTIPVAATDLAKIGESAGQLGVATDAVAEFTGVVAKLAVTTNLTQEEAADSLARIANITQLPQSQFENLGSTVVQLGNRMAATETEIVDFGRRIAGAGKQVGLSVPEILGIGSALASVGIEAEAGGSSISTTIATMAKAVASGGKKLQGFADIAGVSAQEFAKQFKDDPAAAITAFIEGVGRITDEGGNVFTSLEKIGLGGIRVRQTLLNAAGAGDLLRQSIETGTTAFAKNNALQREAAVRFETTESKLKLLANEFNVLAIAAGDKIGPALGDAAGAAQGLLKDLRGNESVTGTLSQGFDNLGRIVKPVIQVFRDNKGVIEDTFRNAGESIRTIITVLKPVAFIVGVTLVLGLKLAFFWIDKINTVSRLFGNIVKGSVSIAINALDAMLGAIQGVLEGLGRLPDFLGGGKFDGAAEGIDRARESLAGFQDELNGVDGKVVEAEVKVKLPEAELEAFIQKLDAAKAGFAGTIRTDVPGAGGQATFGITPLPTKPTKPDKPFKPLQDVPKAIQELEQQKQDNVALAQARTRSLADDRAALVDLARFYTEQANNMELAASIRRGFLVRAEQTNAEIRSIDQGIVTTASDNAEASARAAVAAADATTRNQQDDITARRRLIEVLKDRVDVAKATGEGVAQANAALADAQRDLAAEFRSQREERVDVKEEKARAAVQIASTTEKTLVDDINAQRRIVGVMRERVAIARSTKTGVQAALANLRTEEAALAELLKSQSQRRADARLDAIEDQKKLASFTEGKADDEVALRAEEAFWKNRVKQLKKGTVERRKAFVELRRTQKDIRDLSSESKDGGGETSLADLFSKQVGITGSAGFDVGAQIPGRVTQGIEDEVSARLAVKDPTVNVRAKVDDSAQAVVTSNDKLVAALDRLAGIVGNAGANQGGGGTTYASVTGQRAAAMGRYWQSRRNQQLHEDTASA